MSTRCRIGIKNNDGTIDSIYCHHDGYIEHVGSILVNHYKDEKKIRKLLELGDMSSLGTEPVENPHGWETPGFPCNGDSWFEQYEKLHPENQCVIYKTRGEDCPKATSQTKKEYRELTRDSWGEYSYLFENGVWKYSSYGGNSFRLVSKSRDYDKNN